MLAEPGASLPGPGAVVGVTGPRTAVGVLYPPAGRRHLAVVVVRTCPACGGLHLHRAEPGATVDGAARQGSCGAGYVVRLDRSGGIGGAR